MQGRSPRWLAPWLALACLFPTLPVRAATPFQEDMNQALERVIAWFRTQQLPDGSFLSDQTDPEAGPEYGATGLVAMCFLEKRFGAEFNAPARGYRGMTPEDQELVRKALRFIIESIAGFTPGTPQHTYGAGSGLMAMALYLNTGGPDDVGAPLGVREAMGHAVVNFAANQDASGCWCYSFPFCQDLSNTQFAAMGLSAAASVIPDADAPLARVPAFVRGNRLPDGGNHYWLFTSLTSTHALTASGVWCYRLAGIPASDPDVQLPLTWLKNRYEYDRQDNWSPSFYYYLWAATKGLLVSTDDGLLPGGVFAEQIGGVRDPAAVDPRYAGEARGFFFDFASLLVKEQAADGSWNPERPQGSDGQDRMSDSAFACLVLERSLGGVCLDLDEDGICESDDNCPEHFNPEQADSESDGVGDACDNCTFTLNLDQADSDGDRIGDACDKVTCTPTGEEVCDGLDNDCDGRADNVPGAGELCATELPGVCAAGRRNCLAGELVCRAVNGEPQVEICDGRDNDCNGAIDEGLRNACGRCDALPTERCNGRDDDCDGELDEGDLCPAPQACREGRCAVPCQGSSCADPAQVCVQGFCVPFCATLECPDGQLCDPVQQTCVDPCAGMTCGIGRFCRLGQCGTCEELGCPGGQACFDGQCRPNPCAEVRCAGEQVCRNGACVGTCATLACPLFQSCVDGECVADPCGGLDCGEERACVAGDCGSDPCFEVLCGPGEVCVQGTCQDDQCAFTTCGPGQRCELLCLPDGCTARCLAGDPAAPVAEGEGEGEGEGTGGGPDGGLPGPDSGSPEGEGQRGEGAGEPDTGARETGCGCRTAGPAVLGGDGLLVVALWLGMAGLRRRAGA